MSNHPDDFTTSTRLNDGMVIVGHVLTCHRWVPAGAVVTPFPEIDFHHWDGSGYTPVALVLSYQDHSVPVASPQEVLRAPDASNTKFLGSLVPVWFHRPRGQLVLAPHYWPQRNPETAPIPPGVRAHLHQAPDTVTEIYSLAVR
ncbi:hypothetical protein [Nocardia sp. NPDC003979]